MTAVMAGDTTRTLDLADQAEARGDHRYAEDLYELAMRLEAELLRGAPPIEVGRPRRTAPPSR